MDGNFLSKFTTDKMRGRTQNVASLRSKVHADKVRESMEVWAKSLSRDAKFAYPLSETLRDDQWGKLYYQSCLGLKWISDYNDDKYGRFRS